jgi:hypothetical protein
MMRRRRHGGSGEGGREGERAQRGLQFGTVHQESSFLGVDARNGRKVKSASRVRKGAGWRIGNLMKCRRIHAAPSSQTRSLIQFHELRWAASIP